MLSTDKWFGQTKYNLEFLREAGFAKISNSQLSTLDSIKILFVGELREIDPKTSLP